MHKKILLLILLIPLVSSNIMHQNGLDQSSADQITNKLNLNAETGAIVFSTYLGGIGIHDSALSIFLDAETNIYVAGLTGSSDFPTIGANADTTLGGFSDSFVAKFDSSGSIIFSTYLGGNLSDSVSSIFVDSEENIYVTGSTVSSNFPTAGVNANTTYGGGFSDGFITIFDSSGNIIFSTYLGGSDDDFSSSIFLDAEGNIIVVGETRSSDFPTTGAHADTTYGGGLGDGFISKFDSSGILFFSSYFGGNDWDTAKSITANTEGNMYVAGLTASSDFVTTGANADSTYGGFNDGFVTKFDSSGSVIFSTYLGGNSTDSVNSIFVDPQDKIYVTGSTASLDFPITGDNTDATLGSERIDGFVTEFDSSGILTFSTYLGGYDWDSGESIFVDGEGNIYVAGNTVSLDFPTIGTNADKINDGNWEGFVSKFDNSGILNFSTYLGGGGDDFTSSIFLDAEGNIYVVGSTSSSDFPTTGTNADKTKSADKDAFITIFDEDLTTFQLPSIITTSAENGFIVSPNLLITLNTSLFLTIIVRTRKSELIKSF